MLVGVWNDCEIVGMCVWEKRERERESEILCVIVSEIIWVNTIVHKIVCVRVWGCVCVARVYMYKWVWVFIYVHVCVCVYVQVRVYLSGEFHVELIMNFQRNVEVFLESFHSLLQVAELQYGLLRNPP